MSEINNGHLNRKYPARTGGVPPLPCFLEVLILRDFKSFEPEVLITGDFKSLFPEVLILVGLKSLAINGIGGNEKFLEVLIPVELERRFLEVVIPGELRAGRGALRRAGDIGKHSTGNTIESTYKYVVRIDIHRGRRRGCEA
ncbi:MAG: hypothetical protein WBE97_06480 [Candidatus Acidiferrales bacterium]